MADFKVGTTVGGSPVWHQGNLALVPSGNAILYKGARIYSENDKPTATELQVVSRAGDTMTGRLDFETTNDYPISFNATDSGPIKQLFRLNAVTRMAMGMSPSGAFEVSMNDTSGSHTGYAFKLSNTTFDAEFGGNIKGPATKSFYLGKGDQPFLKDHGNGNVSLSALTKADATPGDLYLGINLSGQVTSTVRLESTMTWKGIRTLVDPSGYIPRTALDNPYYNQTEADARFIRLDTNTVTSGYLLTKANDYGDSNNLDMSYSGFFRHNSIGGFRGLTINVGHPTYTNGAYSRGITFDYGPSYSLYTYAYSSTGVRLANQKIYTEADKPTPAEIGALPAGSNAVSASKLETARIISLTGDASGSVSFDGSANVSLSVTVANDSHTHSDYVKKVGDTMSGNLTVPKVLLSAAQGAEANSAARRDFVEATVTAAGTGKKELDITLPAGAPATGYIPVLFNFGTPFNSEVYLSTLGGGSSLPLNNCSFNGIVRASGWGDGFSYANGYFTIYDMAERSLHSFQSGTESSNFFVAYVETRAFPITVKVDIGTTVTAHATDLTVGTSIFKVNGQESGNTKTMVLANFTGGTGFYNGSNRVYNTAYNPTPEAVGALPVNGNAVTATRLQSARLISGVPFDGTSNIAISATNVGALPITGGTLTGNLTTTGILKGQLYHDRGYFNIGTYGSTYGDGRLEGYFREHNNGQPGVGFLGLQIQHRDAAGVATGKQVDIYLNGKYVYHEDRNPTPAAVGAVALSGDNMTGDLSAPTFKSTGNYAFVRTVDNEHGIFLSNTSDKRTIIGAGTGGGVIELRPFGIGNTSARTVFNTDGTITCSGTPTAATHLATKGYVDTEIGKQVAKTGDTMTGKLAITAGGDGLKLNPAAGSSSFILGQQGGVNNWYIGKGNASDDSIQLFSYVLGTNLSLQSDRIAVNKPLYVGSNRVYDEGFKPSANDISAASSRVNFATQLGINRSITGSTLPSHAGIWAVNNSTWTPVGYGSLLVTTNRADELTTTDSGSFIHYLFISHNGAKTYSATNVNGTWSGWKEQIDNSGSQTINGLLTVGQLNTTGTLYTAKSDNSIIINVGSGQAGYLRGQINGADNWYLGRGSPTTHDLYFYSQAHGTYVQLMSDQLYSNRNIVIGTAQSDLGDSLTRKDYVDGQVATRAPTAHSHSAAAGNADIIAGKTYAIGSYVLAHAQKLNTSIVGVGTNVAGAQLIPASAGNVYWNGVTCPGTWKCMGYAYNSVEVDQRTTLFIRVS